MFVDNVYELCLVFIPLVFGLSVLTVVISAALTHSVPDEDTGEYALYSGIYDIPLPLNCDAMER